MAREASMGSTRDLFSQLRIGCLGLLEPRAAGGKGPVVRRGHQQENNNGCIRNSRFPLFDILRSRSDSDFFLSHMLGEILHFFP